MTTQPIHDDVILALPTTPLANATLDLVARTESNPVAYHSIRSYLFARLLAKHRGAVASRDYDPQLLFLACALHDVGLTEAGNRMQRFEVDGADVAAEFLTAQGLGAAEVDTVWEAIALHTSPGIAARRGVICEMTQTGIGIDLGMDTDAITDAEAASIHRTYPRLSVTRSLVDAIVAQAQLRPEKAPPFTLPGELLRQRTTPPHITLMEYAAATSRWDDE